MIAVLKNGVTKAQRDNLIHWLESQNVRVHVSEGEMQTVLGLIGDTRKIDIDLLAGLEIIDRVTRITDPFKSANRSFHPDDTVVVAGSGENRVKIGGGNFAIMAGEVDLDTLFSMAGEGIYITECKGFHAGANAVTGDFSIESAGFMIENGKKTAPHSIDDLSFDGNGACNVVGRHVDSTDKKTARKCIGKCGEEVEINEYKREYVHGCYKRYGKVPINNTS